MSLSALVILSPLMALVAVLIKLTSQGSALFLQERAGLHGKPFRIVKFRSMVTGAEKAGAGYEIEEDDPRVTAVGKWLRATSIDELPQLWNVLIGDMSIVGPRPCLMYQVASYDVEQARRLTVRPGMTGWAQIHGRNQIPWSRRIEFDLWYVDHLSLLLDTVISLQTVAVVLSRKGFGQDQPPSSAADLSPQCPAGVTRGLNGGGMAIADADAGSTRDVNDNRKAFVSEAIKPRRESRRRSRR